MAQNVLREMLRTIANAVKLYLTQKLEGGAWGNAGSRGRGRSGMGVGDARSEGLSQSTVIFRGDIDRDRVSGINSRCRIARKDLSQWRSDQGPSRARAG